MLLTWSSFNFLAPSSACPAVAKGHGDFAVRPRTRAAAAASAASTTRRTRVWTRRTAAHCRCKNDTSCGFMCSVAQARSPGDPVLSGNGPCWVLTVKLELSTPNTKETDERKTGERDLRETGMVTEIDTADHSWGGGVRHRSKPWGKFNVGHK